MKKTKEFLSIRITRFFMKSVGFWPPSSRVEKLLLNGILCYTLCALASALLIEVTEFYLSMGDIHVSEVREILSRFKLQYAEAFNKFLAIIFDFL